MQAPHTEVELPAGTWVTLAMVTGVATAIVVMRRRRRHRQTPTSSLDPVPAAPPLPPAARALWAAAHATTDDADASETPVVATPPDGRPLWAAAHHCADDDVEDVERAPTAQESRVAALPRRGWPPPAPVVTGRGTAGRRTVDLTAVAGLGLDGDGNTAAARAVLVESLGEDSLHPPVVHLTADAAHQLFPHNPITAVSVPDVLMCHDTTDQAARVVEREVLRRLRLLDEHTHPDPEAPQAAAGRLLDELRVGDPGEPLPTILLVTTALSPDAEPLITGLLGLGRRVGILGVVLGPWPSGLTVDGRYQVTATRGGVAHMRGATLATLTETDTAQLLAVIVAARGGPDTLTHPAGQATEAPSAAAPPTEAPSSEAPRPAQAPPLPAQRPAVYVRVLGVPRIEADGSEVCAGLERRGRQVLAYLAAHNDPVGADTLDEKIFADAEEPRALRNTVISRTRATLAEHAGTTAPIIGLVNGHYRLNPQVVDTDVWRLSRMLATAREASTDEQRGRHLRAILDLNIGEPFDGCAYDWAEETAEPLRRQAVNALLLLAKLTEPDDPATALAALATATTLNPYAEQLYYDAISIYVRNGDHHSARQLYEHLERLLTKDIGKEPEQSIHDLIPHSRTKTDHSPNAPSGRGTVYPTARPTVSPPSLTTEPRR